MADLAPSYTQSYADAKTHGRAFLQSTIGRHPVATAAGIAVLVVIVIYLAVQWSRCRAKATSGFLPINNLNTGGNNPLWQLGGMDAGNGGTLQRDATIYNVGAYIPGAVPARPNCRDEGAWGASAMAEVAAVQAAGGQLGGIDTDAKGGLSDSQLEALMHNGGAAGHQPARASASAPAPTPAL
jgi:hypothetical protein